MAVTVVTRVYGGFRGVDFRGEEISLQRSPDSLNMWRDYKSADSIRTRPGMVLHTAFGEPVYGIYAYGGTLLVHSGETLYRVENGVVTELGSGMEAGTSRGFLYGDSWYFLDGRHYLRYDGVKLSQVEGYVPTTSIGRAPAGGGTVHEDVNLLTPRRINTFLADGKSTEFILDTRELDVDFTPVVKVNGEKVTDFTVDSAGGKITFATAPAAPLTDGQDNVSVEFCKTVSGYAERILGCTLVQVFDNRVFLSGNPAYPNTVWHCSLDDPAYFSDLDYYREGLDDAPITGLAAGNNALWVFRAPGNAGTNIFYHTPALDTDYGKIYPSVHSSVAAGCVGKAINFHDDMVFFSERGMEGISGDITTEQAAAHRSSLVDRKLLAEPGYRDMLLEEWQGYLLIILGDKVYLADSRTAFAHEDHREYEFFYWQLEKPVLCTRVAGGVLYLGTEDGVYTLTGENPAADSWWTTPLDKFKYPGRLKTLDGRGCVAEAKARRLQVWGKTDTEADWSLLGDFRNVEDALVCRVKKKKFKDLRLKFSSNGGFSLETVVLEAMVGGPVKRGR